MEMTKRFYDLCIPYNSNHKLMEELLTELIELGYKTVAIEQTFDHSQKSSVKKGSDVFPIPHDLTFLAEFKSQIKILSRLTIVYNDASISHIMGNSKNLRKYNLIAGLPKTEPALTHCLTTFSGDIVTFDPEGTKLLVHRKNYQVAFKRGMFFEIKYAPVIVNSTCRKDVIKVAHNYYAKGKSRNVFLSSGARSVFELRGPYDVSNLAMIFGLPEDLGTNSIGGTCRQLILKAESRRLGKTIMFARSSGPVCLSSSSEDDDTSEEEEMEAIEGMEKDEWEQPNKKQKIS